MKIRMGDKIKVISGKDLGKEGVVERILKDKNSLVVKGINIAKKHVKPSDKYKEGGIVEITRPVDISNVALVCGKCKKTTRIGYKLAGDRKYRICKKCQAMIDKK